MRLGEKQNINQSLIQSIPLRHKKRKRKSIKSPNHQNNESHDSSEEENRNVLNYNRFDTNLFNYSNSFRTKNNSQKSLENIYSNDKQKENNESPEDIEPIKILEQSMSTSEVYPFLF